LQVQQELNNFDCDLDDTAASSDESDSSGKDSEEDEYKEVTAKKKRICLYIDRSLLIDISFR